MSKSYVDLGADSLTFVQVSLLLEDQLGELPEGWENTPLQELEKRRLSEEERETVRTGTIAPEFVLRAIAILGVVATHAITSDIKGGAYLLFLLAGAAFCRFQLPKLVAGGAVAAAFRPVIRILIGYYLVLLTYAALRGDVSASHWLLTSNLYPEIQSQHNLLPYYWFIAAFCQAFLVASVLFSLPPVRALAKANLWLVALSIFYATFIVSVLSNQIISQSAQIEYFTDGHFTIRTPMFIFYIFAFGICVPLAKTTGKKVWLTISGLATFPFVGIAPIATWLMVGSVLLLWAPPLRAPHLVRQVIVTIAAASFYIFLTHMFPVQAMRASGHETVAVALGVLLVSIVVGIVLMKIAERIELVLRSAIGGYRSRRTVNVA